MKELFISRYMEWYSAGGEGMGWVQVSNILIKKMRKTKRK